MPSPLSLQVLSPELLHRIGDSLKDKDLAHLARVNQFFNLVFAQTLVKRSREDKPSIAMIPALIWAIRQGHKLLIEQIVSDPSFKPDSPDTLGALHEAAGMGDPRIISMLIEVGYSLDRTWGRDSETPLHVSAFFGNPTTTQTLLDHGAKVNAENGDGKTPFQLAVGSTASIVRWRLHKDRPVTQVDRIRAYQTTECLLVSTVRKLVDHGAHLEIMGTDSTGFTPLHHAVLGCIDSDRGDSLGAGGGVIRLLVELGANLHAVNNFHQTPIQLSATGRSGSKTAINCFLDLGISPNLVGPNGLSLLSGAIGFHEKSFEITELLLKRGADLDSKFSLRNIFRRLPGEPNHAQFEKLLILLLLHGADFGGTEAKCFTCAADHGMLDVMKIIAQHHPGMDVNKGVRMRGGRNPLTPLWIGIRSKNVGMLEFLKKQNVKMTKREVVIVDAILG